MTTRPHLLDLFCGVGGAARGYQQAGFYVVGVDIVPQPRYAGDEFVQGDALDVLRLLVGQNDGDEAVLVDVLEEASDGKGFLAAGDGGLLGTVDAHHVGHGSDSPKPALSVKEEFQGTSFDAIHASPPCPDYSRAFRHLALPKPRLIDPLRELLERTGLPWVIENVEGSPLPRQNTLDGRHGVELCGTSFGMRILHHRLFESNIPLAGRSCRHNGAAMNPHNKESRAEYGWTEPAWALEKGITWTKHKREYRDAIPPAYTEFIGFQLVAYLGSVDRLRESAKTRLEAWT